MPAVIQWQPSTLTKPSLNGFARNNLPALPCLSQETDNSAPPPSPPDLQWTPLITEREVFAMCDGMVIFNSTCLYIILCPVSKVLNEVGS